MNKFKINHETSTYDSEAHLEYINSFIASSKDIKQDLMEYAIFLASINAGGRGSNNIEGGPFGSLVFDPENQKVIAIGTNHVVPENDPTAHAEITAAKNVLKLGRGNLRGLQIYTSCECCPMCLSFLLGLEVDIIYFSATREDAASVGFSDEKQYKMLQSGYESCCKETDQFVENEILIESENIKATGNLLNAVNECCGKLKSFHLPADTMVTMLNKPHPFTLVALDWARVGRVRSEENPDDPSFDKDEKDVSKILYHSKEYEDIGLKNIDEILNVVKNGSHKIINIKSSHSYSPFKIWKNAISGEGDNAKKY